MELTAKLSSKELPEYHLYYEEARIIVINRLIRDYNLIEDSVENRIRQSFPSIFYGSISKNANISLVNVRNVIENFLKDASNFKKFLRFCTISWTHTPSKLYRKSRIYLHKVHKIAPIFHYERAKTNLRALHKFFEIEGFWPKISTQLAIVIFITDLLDKSEVFSKQIIQKNLRVLCDCSAYAFHRTRNRMKNRKIFPHKNKKRS